jgi:hypothetical protein
MTITRQPRDYKDRGWSSDKYEITGMEDVFDAIMDSYCILEDEYDEFLAEIMNLNGNKDYESVEQLLEVLNEEYCEFGHEWSIS